MEFTITPDNSFKHTFIGTITESPDKKYFIIYFPDFWTYYVDREEYNKSVDFGFYGFWKPIKPGPFDSLEDYTNFCEIHIKEEITDTNIG